MIIFQMILTAFVLFYGADVILCHFSRIKMLNIKAKQVNNKNNSMTSKPTKQDAKKLNHQGADEALSLSKK